MDKRFDSPALRKTGILTKSDARIIRTLPGYIVDYGVGRASIDIKGRLVEVVYMPETRTHASLRHPTLQDLQQKETHATAALVDIEQHRAAAKGAVKAQWTEDTGKGWNSGQVKSGKRSNKGAAARQQSNDMKKFSRSKVA